MRECILRARGKFNGNGEIELIDGCESELTSETALSGERSEPLTGAAAAYCIAYHEIDPSDGDVFTDAFYAPLHSMFLRGLKGGPSKPRWWHDYAFINVFLLLNILAQAAIAYKVTFLTDDFYGSKGVQLFNSTCWRISAERSDMYNILLPQWMHEESKDKFDCGQPLVTLSLFPERLDLNEDGFWSMTEATEIMGQLRGLGVETSDFPAALQRMIKYDAGQGSAYFKDKIDLSFFKRHRRDIRMCVPTDPAFCANLEAQGHLIKSFSVDLDPDERVNACRSTFHDFCEEVYGQIFISYYLSTQGICGAPSYQLRSGVNIVSYNEVAIYKGKDDSEFGPRFHIFLALLLLIWTLIMLDEFRKTFQFIEVVWRTPSSLNDDEPFATLSADGQMHVNTIPYVHKLYALGVIACARFVLAVVIYVAGTNFLALTDNLLDLILNCTALGFLIEIDNLIHHAFLGVPFAKSVTDKCEALKVQIQSDRVYRSAIGYLVLILLAILAEISYYYHRKWGILDIGHATECLCNIGGHCLAARLIVPE